MSATEMYDYRASLMCPELEEGFIFCQTCGRSGHSDDMNLHKGDDDSGDAQCAICEHEWTVYVISSSSLPYALPDSCNPRDPSSALFNFGRGE